MAIATLATIDDVVARINARFSIEKPAGGFADATTLAGVKALTDAATDLPTASTLMRRDANGDSDLRELVVSQDPSVAGAVTRKSWVDTQIASRLATSLLGAASGVASLDSGGKIPTSQLPPLAINETFVAASQAAMLALTAQRGDMARRTDLTPNRMFVLAADDATTLANWIEINAAGAVTSVDGQTGAVSLGSASAGASTLARRTSTGQLVAADASAASELTTKTQVDTALALKESVTNVDTVRNRVTAIESGRARLFAYAGAAQTGLAAGWQDMYLNLETIDTHGGHVTNANPVSPCHQFTVPTGQGGRYRVSGTVVFNTSGSLNARIVKNGATIPYGTGVGQTTSSTGCSCVTGEKLLDLVAGDVIHMQGFNNTGSWATATFSDGATHMSIERID